jgi:hypothetical protein
MIKSFSQSMYVILINSVNNKDLTGVLNQYETAYLQQTLLQNPEFFFNLFEYMKTNNDETSAVINTVTTLYENNSNSFMKNNNVNYRNIAKMTVCEIHDSGLLQLSSQKIQWLANLILFLSWTHSEFVYYLNSINIDIY